MATILREPVEEGQHAKQVTGRKPEAYVRFRRRKNSKGGQQVEMQLGRAAWYAAGRPDRVALEWRAEGITIVPGEDGWKLHIRPNSPPSCWLPVDIEIEPGRYAVAVQDGVIAVGAREGE